MLTLLAEFTDFFNFLNIFRYITFRTGMSAVTSFLLCLFLAPRCIAWLKKLKIKEICKREHCEDLEQFQKEKEGTPTMGGVFIIFSIVMTSLLWADLQNVYVWIVLFTIISLAIVGFIDDMSKLTNANGKRGISSKVKFSWQVLIAGIVGLWLVMIDAFPTTVHFPFFKNFVLGLGIFFIFWSILVLVGSSNAVNLTDGMDGLAIGCVLFASITLGILSYIAGHFKFSSYLFLPFVSGAGELTVICAAILGASLGFLWFNCFPASIFMGDVGSLPLGGCLGVISLLIKQEVLLVLIGGVFVMEALSVIIQVTSFKTRGKRVFKMAPFHHHLQLSGWKESQVITRLWILAVIFSMIALMTLKIR